MNARKFFDGLIALLLLTVIFWPWALGALDAGWWAITGQQLSSVPWDSGRGGVAMAWPFVACVAAAIFIE